MPLLPDSRLWCGRVDQAQGIGVDPERTTALTQVPPPTTVAQLMQFICSSIWLSESFPNCAQLINPLGKIYKKELSGSPIQSKKYAARIHLHDVGWSEQHSGHI
uniref:Uncharacterized protein n=1 Tax=Spongospora subterranea TaxID=70186 RepID=A0A0H5RE68_9EUKA|eukprot:CRZ11837.1 hypothetical protein [Spongospora subterranea]